MHPGLEELALYRDGKTDKSQTAALEAHLAACPDCAEKIAAIPTQAAGVRPEMRSEPRTPSGRAAQLQVLHPLSLETVDVRIWNVSPAGLAIRSKFFVAPGSDVKVRMEAIIKFGRVCYCVRLGDEFQAGIKVHDVLGSEAH